MTSKAFWAYELRIGLDTQGRTAPEGMEEIRTEEILQKIVSLFEELQQHPETGTGQVEQLKGNLQGYWSRRIDKGSRLIYKIEQEIVTVFVISLKGHYGDK